MKPNLAISLCIIISLVSCYNPGRPAGNQAKAGAPAIKPKQKLDQGSVDRPAHVYAKGDSSCVVVNNKTLCLSKKYKIDLANTLPLICQVKNGIIERSAWLNLGNFTLISIDQGTGRGYTELYAIDNKTQTLVKDEIFKRDYLSGFGIFVVNGYNIFTMHKYLYNENYDMRSAGSLYSIKNDRFVYIKSRVQKNEIDFNDTAIINFSQKPLNKKF
jgi:hypothetical protein